MRFMHRAYWRGAGVSFFFARRICPAGFGVCAVLILAGVVGVGKQQDTVYQLFSLASALVVIGLPWAFLRRARGLEARRELPRYATAGETVHCIVHVRNRGAKRVHAAWLAETPPDPRPSLSQFANSREPGESQRNLFDRKFAYYRWQWLLDRNRLYDDGRSLLPMDLAPGATAEVGLELVPQRRGVIQLNDLRVLLPDPFGLFQRCIKMPAPAATLTVMPHRYRIPPVELPGSGRFQIGGDASTNAIGSSGEFVGLREYRPGDPLRQIHWKSWARTGRPIVKELEDTFYPRYGLVLDTFPASGNEQLFEDAVSVAASFASTLDTRESLLDLMFIKDRAHTVTVGRGIARAEKLLEVLAGVEAEPIPQFDTLANLVIRHREELTSCLIVLCGWDDERAAFVRKLSSQGLGCVVLVSGQGPGPQRFAGHWIESGHLARDLGALPVRLRELG